MNIFEFDGGPAASFCDGDSVNHKMMPSSIHCGQRPAWVRRSKGPSRWTYGDVRRFVQLLSALTLLVAFSTDFAAAAAPVRIVALGDSLTAGYQLSEVASFPAVLQRALQANGVNVEVANAGVSGDTANDGLARLDWSIPDGTAGVIVELGANDMLRGTDPAVTRAALDRILARLQERRIGILLAGMRAAPNLGEPFRSEFDAIYPQLAAKYHVPLYPFFLDGIVADPKLNLADGMHPNPAGVEVIVARILPAVETLIRSVSGGS
jgi:acyl-CoA thioesterase-1